MICPKCGASIDENAKFCSACGAPISSEAEKSDSGLVLTAAPENNEPPVPVEATLEAVPTATAKNSSKKVVFIVLVLLLLVIAGVVFFKHSRGPNFKKLYDEYCRSTWADVGTDGSYLSIDTNPFDEDDNGLAYPEAYTAIKKINEALELPDSLINDMGSTASIDGKQSESFDKANVIVTWKYHPDKGLEVSYKKLK